MKLLMILNTPPPYQGTTIMNQYLLDTLKEREIDFIHLRIDSSRDLRKLGKLNFSKVSSALRILGQIFVSRKKFDTAYLVMSVEGFAFYRHCLFVLMLLLIRKKCILHLRGLGFRNKKGIGKFLTSFIFSRAYLIQHSSSNSFDIDQYGSRKIFYVPNGWHDYYDRFEQLVQGRRNKPAKDLDIIFLSNLIADKGLFTVTESILEISADPAYRDMNIKWNFVGNWESEAVRKEFYEFVDSHKLERFIGHVGPLYNDEKYSFLAGMDILTFPTFYKHETWGNVILEAMMFRIPVIATRYVAIPDMVKDNLNGFLIGREDPAALSSSLKHLIDNPVKRYEMGVEGRNLFLRNFTLGRFKSNMVDVLQSISS